MAEGFIKLWRCLLEKSIWTQSTPEQKAVFITLLMLANHKEKQWEWNGKKFEANPGQFVTSLQQLAEKSGVTIQNVRTALNRFKKLDFLTDESTKTGRLVTIVNWRSYQDGRNKSNKEDNSQLTKSQQRPNKDLTTNKNDKNDKNISSRPKFKFTDDHMELAEHFRSLITNRKPDYKFNSSIESWANEIRLMEERDNRPLATIQAVIEWSQQDSFWQNNCLSPTSLRKQFDRLEMNIKSPNKQSPYPKRNFKVVGEDYADLRY